MSIARFGIALGAAVFAMDSAAALRQQDPHVLTTIDGEIRRGVVVAIAEDTVTMRTAGGELSLPLETLTRIDLADSDPPRPDSPRLWLRSGQVLPALYRDGDDRVASFTLPFATGSVAIPWRFIRAVRFGSADTTDASLLERAANPPDDVDLLYANAGGGNIRRLSVRFLGIRGNKAVVDFQGSERTLSLDKVHGVVFGTSSGTPPDDQPNPLVQVHTRTGHSVTGKLKTLDDQSCRLFLAEGPELVIPRDRVTTIVVQSDKLIDLTRMEPGVEQTPAFDRTWPWLRNHAPGGGPITIGGEPYRSGLVLIPRTRLTYRIDGRYDVFEAVLGMDDQAGPHANAVLRVLGDGVVLHDTGPITRADKPRTVRIDISGVQRLTPEADFGKNFDLGDVCVFAAPRLLRN